MEDCKWLIYDLYNFLLIIYYVHLGTWPNPYFSNKTKKQAFFIYITWKYCLFVFSSREERKRNCRYQVSHNNFYHISTCFDEKIHLWGITGVWKKSIFGGCLENSLLFWQISETKEWIQIWLWTHEWLVKIWCEQYLAKHDSCT